MLRCRLCAVDSPRLTSASPQVLSASACHCEPIEGATWFKLKPCDPGNGAAGQFIPCRLPQTGMWCGCRTWAAGKGSLSRPSQQSTSGSSPGLLFVPLRTGRCASPAACGRPHCPPCRRPAPEVSTRASQPPADLCVRSRALEAARHGTCHGCASKGGRTNHRVWQSVLRIPQLHKRR